MTSKSITLLKDYLTIDSERSFDYVRTGLNKNLGFTPEDREENIRRVAEVSIVLSLELHVEEGEPGLKLNPGSRAARPFCLLPFAICPLPEALRQLNFS